MTRAKSVHYNRKWNQIAFFSREQNYCTGYSMATKCMQAMRKHMKKYEYNFKFKEIMGYGL